MSIRLSPELEEMRDVLRKFTTKELEPIARIIDETGEVPDRVAALLANNGYLGMRVDEKYGGGGMGLAAYCLAQEEFSRAHRVFTNILAGSSGNTPLALMRLGTEAQRNKYLPGLANGTLRAAFALTEPGSGSDSQAMKTRASRMGGGWAIDGRKHYINGGDVADFIMVMAVTDAEKRGRGGITAFIVDKGAPGFSVSRVDTTMGSRAIKLAELTFENCRVGDDAVVGEVGQGFKIAMQSIDEGRMSVACSCIGIADRLLELSTSYAMQRVTFGQPLSERQAIQWMLADSAMDLEAARALAYATIQDIENGADTDTRPSMSKLFCSEMVGRVADRAVQIHGGMGIVQGYPVERFYRDVRHYRVGEGSSEIQRILIARDLFKRAQQKA